MRIAMLMFATMAMVAASSLRADEGEGNKPGDRPDRGDRKTELLKQFDKDNSGDLNEEERAAARAAFEKRRGQQGEAEGQRRRRGGPGGFDRAALMKQFDKDESGDLNEEERAALRKHFEEMRAKRGEGQGQRGARPAFDREKIIAEFDKDKDGKLSEEERTAAREAMKERFQKLRQERGGDARPQRGEGQPRKRPAE